MSPAQARVRRGHQENPASLSVSTMESMISHRLQKGTLLALYRASNKFTGSGIIKNSGPTLKIRRRMRPPTNQADPPAVSSVEFNAVPLQKNPTIFFAATRLSVLFRGFFPQAGNSCKQSITETVPASAPFLNKPGLLTDIPAAAIQRFCSRLQMR